MVHSHNLRIALLMMMICLSGWLRAQQEEFDQGNALYNEQQYTQALALYEKALESGKHSSALYFNMGNAHYKLNNIPQSIYFYEKALLLDPGDAEILNNLQFARQMTLDDIKEMPSFGLWGFAEGLSGYYSRDQWAVTSIVLSLSFALLFLAYWFAHRPGMKRLWFTSSMIVLALTVAAVSLAWSEQRNSAQDQPAIVFTSQVAVKAEPNLSSQTVFELHEGAKTWILNEMGEWSRVRLADGKTGWLPTRDMRRIKDF